MKDIVLVFLVDALRHDYINQDSSPFIEKLRSNGIFKIVDEPITFECYLLIFTGLYQDQLDIINLFDYNPPVSPWRFLKIFPLKFLQKIRYRNRIFNFGLNYILQRFAQIIERIKGNTASYHTCNPHEIPLEFLPRFAFGDKRLIYLPGSVPGKRTFFDVLKEKGKNWDWIAYPTHDIGTPSIMKQFNKLKNKDNIDFLFIHFSELDFIGHKFGPDSKEIREEFSQIDNVIRLITNHYNKKRNVKIMVFGDHGMVKVQKSVDILKKLKNKGLITKKMIFFIDSIELRIWTDDSEEKTRLMDYLSKLNCGFLLNEENSKKLHLETRNRKFGDIVFIAYPGIVFLPNFFQRSHLPKGMHGYGPGIEGNQTCVIINSKDIKKKYALNNKQLDLTDLYYCLLELIDVREYIPKKKKILVY
ncbi:MAG: alkaline phosphatase family protein [Candidatus Hodarchaeota archaeon]